MRKVEKPTPKSMVLLAQGIHDDADLAAIVAATMQDIAAERLSTRVGFAILAGARVLMGLSEQRHRRGGAVVLNPRGPELPALTVEATPADGDAEMPAATEALEPEHEDGFCQKCGRACIEHKSGLCRACRKAKPGEDGP